MKEGLVMKRVIIYLIIMILWISGCGQMQLHKEMKQDVKKEPEIKKEEGVVHFINDIPIVVHKDSITGDAYGYMYKNEIQAYTHTYLDDEHRYIIWEQDGVQCFCAVSDEKKHEQWAVERKVERTKHRFDKKEVEKIIQNVSSQYDGVISIYFKDLKSNSEISYRPLQMYPCSIIKMALMVSIYHDSEFDKVDLEECKPYLESMMIDSDNTSYNYLLKILGNGDGLTGIKRVNTLLRQFGLYKTTLHHGLLPGNYFVTDQGSNESSAKDIGLLLEMIYEYKVATIAHCNEMIALMSRCSDPSGLRNGLMNQATFAHKAGWAYEYYLDGGIVYAPNRNYILVIFTNNVSNEYQLCYDLSNKLYDYVERSKE